VSSRVSALHRPEIASVLAVVVVTVAALAAGWWLRESVLHATRQVEAAGITAEVPVDWLVNEGVGELAFSAHMPAKPLPRFSVIRIETESGSDLAGLAAARAVARGQTSDAFEVIREESGSIDGRLYTTVFYRYVTEGDGDGDGPIAVQGMDVYERHAEDVLVLSLEALESEFDSLLGGFESFRSSVTQMPAEGQ
jgi:hypothetical protein